MSDTMRPPSLTPPTEGGPSDTTRPSSLTQPANIRKLTQVRSLDAVRQSSLTPCRQAGMSDTLRHLPLSRPREGRMSDTLRPPSLTPPTAGGLSDTLRPSSLTQPAARRTVDTWRPPSLTTPPNVRASDTRQPPSLPPQSLMENTCGHSAFTKNQNYGSSFTPRPTLLYGPQAVDGSAQRPRSGGVRGPQSQSEKIASWHAEKATLGTPDQKPSERESILYRLADTCTSLMHDNGGRIGVVARSLGGFLVTPPVDPQHIRRYFGELKGFPQIDELLTIVSGGVPVIAPPSRADLNAALQYGNHRSAQAHLPLIWKKLAEDVRREMPSD